jgi:NAD+ synthase (glutamine-hydrolysing)
MKITLAQINLTIGDFKGNFAAIVSAIEHAQSEGSELIVFSELAVCAYPPDDLLNHKSFVEDCQNVIHYLLPYSKKIAIIIGSPTFNSQAEGRQLYNSACVLQGGHLTHTIHKTLLPTYDVFDESRYFEPNTQFELVKINGNQVAITICEDLWFDANDFKYKHNPLSALSALNPDVVINLSASPFNQHKQEERYDTLKRAALGFNKPLIYVNQVGAHTDLIFDGCSMVFNAQGEMCWQAKAFDEAIYTVDTNHISPVEETTINSIEEIYNALVFGLKDYFQKNGFKTALLGSSGGIDSAVVQALLSDAIGAENVTAVLMPSKYSSEGSVKDAMTLSQQLGNPYFQLPIATIIDAYDKVLDPLYNGLPIGLAEENIQARTRANLLMSLSNKFGHILINTSNKSELSVGYSTLYGDLCGSLSAIGDVYKTQVYALAQLINSKANRIPESIIHKAPSAELRPDQKDSDSLPEYHFLDAILYLYIEKQLGNDEIIALGHDAATVAKVLNLVKNSEYKRFQAPPVLRVSSKSFGRGRIIPLVKKW